MMPDELGAEITHHPEVLQALHEGLQKEFPGEGVLAFNRQLWDTLNQMRDARMEVEPMEIFTKHILNHVLKPYFFYRDQFEGMKNKVDIKSCGWNLLEAWESHFRKQLPTGKVTLRGQEWDIPCKAKCSGCCHQQVILSEAEISYALAFAEDRGVKVDWAKVEKQKAADDADKWTDQGWDLSACVFLNEEGNCSIYEARPIACRSHIALLGPKECDWREHPNGVVPFYSNIEIEVFNSAVMTVFRHDRNIAQGLWEIKQKESISGVR